MPAFGFVLLRWVLLLSCPQTFPFIFTVSLTALRPLHPIHSYGGDELDQEVVAKTGFFGSSGNNTTTAGEPARGFF